MSGILLLCRGFAEDAHYLIYYIEGMLDIITIGTATRDALAKSASFKIIHAKKGVEAHGLECVPLGSKIEIGEMEFTTGGAATNAAVTFARQGFRTSIVARVGDDANGTEIRRELMREGVDISRMIVDREHPTAYSMILSYESGERSILVHRGASGFWDIKDVHQKPLEARWLYISSLGGDFDLLAEIMHIAKKHNIRVAMNPGTEEIKLPHKLVPFLYSIDILIMNREEGARFTGVAFEKEKEIFKRIDELEPGIFVLTDGPKGVWVSDGTRIYRAGKFPEKKVADRTGAGDAFGSGFVAGIMRRMNERSKNAVNKAMIRDLDMTDISYAIRLGSANATSKVEGIGAKYGLLTKHDFEKNVRWAGIPMKMAELKDWK